MTNLMNTEMLLSVLAFIVIAVISVALVLSTRRARAIRTAHLKDRFGPEYDRAVDEHGDRGQAERELMARTRRIERQRRRDLNPADRQYFESSWGRVQAQFFDDPAGAVAAADDLIAEVMRARGYPEDDDFEQRVADLSVDHASVVQHYRAAQALATAGVGDPTNTEELRQAVVHYRALFTDLLQGAPWQWNPSDFLPR
jgi:hypothetical protein